VDLHGRFVACVGWDSEKEGFGARKEDVRGDGGSRIGISFVKAVDLVGEGASRGASDLPTPPAGRGWVVVLVQSRKLGYFEG
jgi:hypothetical protein